MDGAAWLEGLLGGGLLGLGGAVLWLGLGRTVGISGIAAGVLVGRPDRGWRLAFLAGLAAAGAALGPPVVWPPVPVLLVAGLLVGIGTRIGNGCTSGHGVCGVSRLSSRSLTATCVFVGVAMGTVAVVRALGGAP